MCSPCTHQTQCPSLGTDCSHCTFDPSPLFLPLKEKKFFFKFWNNCRFTDESEIVQLLCTFDPASLNV